MQNLISQAKNYAKSIDHADGVVVFFDNELQGWQNCLRDPQNWRPGAIAVNVFDGCQWVATGGDDQDGAQQWSVSDNADG